MDSDLDEIEAPRGRSMDTVLLLLALVAVAGMLAWFFLGSNNTVVDTAVAPEPVAADEAEAVQAVVTSESVNDELLSRARLAAESGMLVEPASSNALYYYSLYREQDPQNETVAREFDTVVTTVGESISAAMAANDWRRAAFLADQLNNAGATSSSVDAYRAGLEAFRSETESDAVAAARGGDEARANALLDTLAGLPRAEPAAILAARSAVRDELVAFRVAAQQREAAAAQAARQRAAAAESRRTAPAQQPARAAAEAPAPADPYASVRSAISAGQLAGESGAIALLAAAPQDANGRDEVGASLMRAIDTAVRDAVGQGDLGTAESLQQAYDAVDSAGAANLSGIIDQAYIERAVAETVSAATLRRISAVAPVYPRSAVRRRVSGRLRMEFTVDIDGTTRDIEVVESAAAGIFDRSAIRAVSEWRYEPRVVRGQPVAQRVYAYVDYALE